MCGRFDTASLNWADIHAQLSRFAPVTLDTDDWAAWLDPTRDAQSLMATAQPERFEVIVV